MSANILQTSKDMLSLDIQPLVEKFKGCQSKHIKELLLLRNDLTKTEINDQLESLDDNNRSDYKRQAGVPSIFHKVEVQTSWFG